MLGSCTKESPWMKLNKIGEVWNSANGLLSDVFGFLSSKNFATIPAWRNDFSLLVLPIDGFHGDVIRLQSQKSEVLRILIYTRLKISRKYIFVQVSSPEACFISKIQQFEVPSFHSAWHQKRNAISLKKSLSAWFSAV